MALILLALIVVGEINNTKLWVVLFRVFLLLTYRVMHRLISRLANGRLHKTTRLLMPQLRINTVLCDECLMAALLDDLAVLKHH